MPTTGVCATVAYWSTPQNLDAASRFDRTRPQDNDRCDRCDGHGDGGGHKPSNGRRGSLCLLRSSSARAPRSRATAKPRARRSAPAGARHHPFQSLFHLFPRVKQPRLDGALGQPEQARDFADVMAFDARSEHDCAAAAFPGAHRWPARASADRSFTIAGSDVAGLG